MMKRDVEALCSKDHTWSLQQVTVKHLLPCLVWELDSLGAVATYSDHWSAYERPVSILVHIHYVYCCMHYCVFLACCCV